MLRDILSLGRFRCRAFINNVPGAPIVFLHGYMFTSDVWNDINVLKVLEENNIPFLALDMPYGLKSKCNPKSRDPDENVMVVREAIHGIFGGGIHPVLVGASLGGYIALKYSVENPVLGLMLIAPVHGLDPNLVKNYKNLKVPVYIIYGTKDKIVELEEMKKLASHFERSKLIIYEDAEHPAYLTYPERFKQDLLELYREIHSRIP
ncbi:alpha/beta hydrolase [Desulfurococcaceae archaeon MEX13E-LK6-19]|nr:alpha/beta hydrolase [Desulfurococcaceae archaeon MEX13E-LK6-19]